MKNRCSGVSPSRGERDCALVASCRQCKPESRRRGRRHPRQRELAVDMNVVHDDVIGVLVSTHLSGRRIFSRSALVHQFFRFPSHRIDCLHRRIHASTRDRSCHRCCRNLEPRPVLRHRAEVAATPAGKLMSFIWHCSRHSRWAGSCTIRRVQRFANFIDIAVMFKLRSPGHGAGKISSSNFDVL